jgi:hypothetical protein
MNRHCIPLTILSIAALLSLSPVRAQTSLPLPLNIQHAVQKGTRTTSGEPGAHYWQNRADYSIQVNFDPVTRLVRGSESIAYTNNSPDTLHELVFKLYPNLYKKGAERLMAVQPEDLTDGVAVTDLTVEGVPQPKPAALPGRRGMAAGGTDMPVRIPLLIPGQSVHVSLGFSYTLNKTSHIRTGQVDSGAFFIAYFFPRIAVYDDIDGWNRQPYLGPQEFYNDFCNFSVNITVPGNYMVWATGNQVNRSDVWAPAYDGRINQAEDSGGVVTIIGADDLAKGGITQHADSNTWKFEARDVTDFVFALSNHYIWKASSLVVDTGTGRRTRVDAVFNPAHKDFDEVVDFARKTVEAMSCRLPAWPYPYPHETVFDGLDQMEYPMMVNDNPLASRTATISLTDHEIFHTMFPFYMGVNETKYAWMDEGWATMGEWLISPMIDSSIVDGYGIEPYSMGAGKEEDLPIITLSTEETGNTYYLNSYPKPGLGYLYARDILGDSAFLAGLHHYITQWHGKHPIPTDFFASMNAGSGTNLDWFWRRWFYDGGYPDLGIGKVTRDSAQGNGWSVEVVNKGGKPVPVDLTIFFADGSKEKVHLSIGFWRQGEPSVKARIYGAKAIEKITLGSTYVPDTHPQDNVWIMP